MAIDPSHPQIIYTNSGYGSNGAFKSTNGGVDWQPFWPPLDGSLPNVVEYNFVAHIVLDPTDPTHIVVTFHALCHAPYQQACLAELKNGTWGIISGDPSWKGGEGAGFWFLDNGQTLLWGSQSNGLWRTTDGGKSWTQIDSSNEGHASGQMVRTQQGTYFLAATGGILRSSDGVKWSLVANSGDLLLGLTTDGTTLYSARGFPWNYDANLPTYAPFLSSAASDGTTWKPVNSPLLTNGGQLEYDPDHHILYSSNEYGGFWRVVLP